MRRLTTLFYGSLVVAALASCADSMSAADYSPGIEPNPSPGTGDGEFIDGPGDPGTGGDTADTAGTDIGPGDTDTEDTDFQPCEPLCLPGWQCGGDGCGGSCGDCPVGLVCNAAHMCVADANPPTETGPNGECLAQCTGAQCGPDGCGGACGWCSGADSCQEGACVTVEGCTPDCAGKMIGLEDGCGGVCSGGGFGIGLVPGGAQDAAYFTSQVMGGEVPEANLLPIEGWLNQHGTALPPPLYDRLVTLHAFVGLFYDPAEGEPTVALQLGMNSGLSPDQIEEGQFNLSVVIDRSGSMSEANKIDFVRDGLIQMLEVLDGDDTLSIVTYSTTAKIALEPTLVTEENKPAIQALIESINPGGKTNLHAGLKLGYEQVMKNIAQKDLTPRVILLSDGIANEGITDTPSILNMSGAYNESGIGVTTIGVGQDLELSLMQMLASQGNGNFYFLDTAEKLEQVFQEEIEYLLTPVADNLQLWFTLADGFGVEDVYGFEFKQSDGEVHLLGPSPQYTVSDGEIVEEPPDTGEEPNVAVSTLFASKKNGLLMIKLSSPQGQALTELGELTLSTVNYAYELVETGELEEWDVDVTLGSLEYDAGSGAHAFYSGAIMQKNFCVLRLGLAMKQACATFHELGDDGIQASITTLAQARTFCEGINVQLNDADIVEDVVVLETLMDNICGETCVEPASGD